MFCGKAVVNNFAKTHENTRDDVRFLLNLYVGLGLYQKYFSVNLIFFQNSFSEEHLWRSVLFYRILAAKDLN